MDKASNKTLMLHLGTTLFLITAITALLLSGVNAITFNQIAALAEQKKIEAMNTVLPGGTLKNDLTVTTETATVYTLELADGTNAYCVEVSPSGFGGAINVIVGIKVVDGVKEITGVSIITMSETAGLGTKARDESFLSQFIGLKSDLSQSNIKVGTGENDIDAISGATVTSKAVTAGINMALDAVSAAQEVAP